MFGLPKNYPVAPPMISLNSYINAELIYDVNAH
jgi:ubiquitin-protein ligase